MTYIDNVAVHQPVVVARHRKKSAYNTFGGNSRDTNTTPTLMTVQNFGRVILLIHLARPLARPLVWPLVRPLTGEQR